MKEFWKSLSTNGIHVPFIFDGETGKPSITLMFAYVTFVLAVISLVALHFRSELLTATITSITFWAVAVVLYRMRKIDKLKFNLEERSVEVGAEDNNSNTNEKESLDAPKP